MHLKYSVTGNEVEDDEFYELNIMEKFDDEVMAKHVYRDPVHLGVHIVLCRSLINVFMTFHYIEDPNTKDFAAQFPFHHEQMLVPFIDIVDDEFMRYFTDIKNHLDEMEGQGNLDAHRVLSSDLQMLKSAKAIITMGNIAKLLLKCTDIFQAKKNWKSHGASVGSVICQFASILSQLTTACAHELKENFNVLIPQGNEQMGSKHGHHNVCYSEYMCSTLETRVMGNLEVYLNLDTFRRDHHADKVKKLFEETVPGYPHTPAPRPMRAHTFDFNCMYEVACLVDGECKATKPDIAFMVLHSTEQLVTQDMAMSVLTTSQQMEFYKTVKMRGSGHLKTYELGHVQDLNVDAYKEEPHIQKPPKCFFRCPLKDNCESVMVEIDPHILKLWNSLHSEPKLFIHAIMHTVDILAEHFSSLNLKEVKRMHNKTFNKRWKEPEYRMTTAHDLQMLLWNLNLLVTLKINCMKILWNNTGRPWRI